ncbi:MlaD family protein [Haloechinothrix salitolerans]|uniref:MlaD family protein n=1 Tax=Haloechinothrix salitolerans TaxID=926830 RepID=A0ABW2BXX2_9PSEU
MGTVLSTSGDDDTLHLVAEFADASPLLVGNDVKLSGVAVGKTVSMDVVDGVARVGLELNRTALPVHQDARATIRPVSLLGERFVDLDRGSPGAPVLTDGDVIRQENTGQNVGLDQVLNSLDGRTSDALAALVTTLGVGMKGNGKQLDAAVRKLAPAMANTDRLAKVLNEHNDLLNRLVSDAVPVAKALASGNGKTMDRLVAKAHDLLQTTAANQQQMDASLAEMPETVRVVRGTLADLTRAANATSPTLAELRPVTDTLTELSTELNRFSTAANGALAAANPLLEKANTMVEKAAPVAASLRKAGPDMKAVAKSGAPIVKHLSVKFDDVVKAIRNWALTTNGRDGLSHYFRGLAVVTPESLTGLIPQQTVPGTKAAGKKPDSPQPALPTLPGIGADGKPLSGLLSAEPTDDGGVTGLSKKQEGGLLGSLLGGN